jgi:sodium/proline symporter
MMSTADSELLVCSSSASRDVYHNIRSETSGGKKMLLITRIMTLSVSALALLAALFMQETVYSFVSYAWAGLGSSFGPALVLLLFWKKFSRAGLFASLICGSVGTIIWKNFLAVPTGVSERLGSYVFAFLMAVAFSLLLPEKRREA